METHSKVFDKKVSIIRGTDFNSIIIGYKGDCPTRYIKNNSYVNRVLKPFDIVIENSVNYRSRATGSNIIITQEILERFDQAVICASFCKLLRPVNHDLSVLINLSMKESYQSGALEKFQLVSSNGIANFQMQYFMKNFKMIIPPEEVLNKFTEVVYPFVSNFPNNENRHLQETRDYLLPKLISGKIRIEEAEKEVEKMI